MAELIVHDGPDDHCFGCGHRNERGLKLAFRATENGAEAEYVVPEWLAGAPGVAHGGVQAALLDEVLGMAAHLGSGQSDIDIVTVDFQLRYRRPAPTERRLRIQGRLLRVEGRDFFVEGEIVGPEGDVLTRAEARWRRIERQPAPR
jgi:uncharacterized protein (TIGR00369 family)